MIDLVSSEEITHSIEASAPSESSSSSEEKIDRYAFRRNAFFEHDGLDESSGADEVRHEHEARHGAGDSQQYDEDGFEIYDPAKFNDVVLVPPTRVLLNTNNNHNAANAVPNAASASVARPVSNLNNNAAISNNNNSNSQDSSQNAGVKRTGNLDNWLVSPAPAPSPSGQGSLSRSGSFQMRLAEDEEYARKLQAELDAEPVERELFECPVCLEEKPLDSKFLYQKCEHEQCRECAAEFFQRQIELGLEIKCILCQSPVSVLDLELVLDVPEVKKYRKLIGEKDVDEPSLQAVSTPPPVVPVAKVPKKRPIKKVPIVAPPKKVHSAKQAVAPKPHYSRPLPPPQVMHNQVLKQSSPPKLSASGGAVGKSDNHHLSHSGSKQSAVVVPPNRVDDLVSLQQQRILNNSNNNNSNAISNSNNNSNNHNYHPYPVFRPSQPVPVQQLPKKLDALPSHLEKVSPVKSSLSASKQKEKSEGWMANDSEYHPHHNNDNAADVGAGPVTRASARKRKAATLDG